MTSPRRMGVNALFFFLPPFQPSSTSSSFLSPSTPFWRRTVEGSGLIPLFFFLEGRERGGWKGEEGVSFSLSPFGRRRNIAPFVPTGRWLIRSWLHTHTHTHSRLHGKGGERKKELEGEKESDSSLIRGAFSWTVRTLQVCGGWG